MKRLNLLTVSILISIITFSQNFPGNKVDLLIEKKIRIEEQPESSQSYGYDGFYIKSDLKKKYACCDKYNSKYSSLEGKIFNVISYEKYTNSIGTEKFKLKIENDETGIIYYDYNPKYEHSFPFTVIGGIDFPEGYFCEFIEESKDKFTDKITYNSPQTEGISFTRVKSADVVSTYLSIRVHGSTLNIGKTGAIILFEDGTKLERPDAEVDCKVGTGSLGGYTYSVFLSLSESDIRFLSEKIMTDVRVYIYDGNVRNGKKLNEYAKCISKK